MTVPGAAGGVRHRSYAGLVSRVAALAVDVAVLCTATVAVRMLPELVWSQIFGRAPAGWLGTAATVTAGLLPWVYFTVCWWLTGQTVGDLLIGVRVTHDEDGDVTLVRAALRSAAGLLLAPLWMVGLVGVLWDRRRRAWHDILFGTTVHYAAKRSALRASG